MGNFCPDHFNKKTLQLGYAYENISSQNHPIENIPMHNFVNETVFEEKHL